jgi:hypothetical protein
MVGGNIRSILRVSSDETLYRGQQQTLSGEGLANRLLTPSNPPRQVSLAAGEHPRIQFSLLVEA